MNSNIQEESQPAQYLYRLERVTHRPRAEDKVTTLREFEDSDLKLSRILATKAYLEEIGNLEGKYSPPGYKTYDTARGIGYNYFLRLVEKESGEMLIVESTMEDNRDAVQSQKKEEKLIFHNLNLDYPTEVIEDGDH